MSENTSRKRRGWPYWGIENGQRSLFIPLTLLGKLSPSHVLLFAAMAAEGDAARWTTVDEAALGKESGQKPTAVARDLAKLQKKGLVELRWVENSPEYRITARGEALILGLAS